MLCTVLNQWRTNLMAGASLKTTNLKRQHPKHVYTHFQYSGTPGPNVCAPQMLSSSATTKVGARRAVTAAAMPAREPLIHTSQSVRGN